MSANPKIEALELSRLQRISLLLAFVLMYYATARVSLLRGTEAGDLALFWIPSGIAFGAVFFFGSWLWVGIALATFIANLKHGTSAPIALLFSALHSMQVTLPVFLLKSVPSFRFSLERPRDVTFLVISIFSSSVFTGTLAALSLSFAGFSPWSNLPGLWLGWFVSHSISLFILGSFVLTTFAGWRLMPEGKKMVEWLLLLTSFLLVACLIFFVDPGQKGFFAHSSYILPYLFWLALRFNLRTVSSFLLLLSGLAITGLLLKLGVFARGNAFADLLLIQLFLGIYSVATLLVASISFERARFAREREQRLRQIADFIPQLVWTSDPKGQYAFSNRRAGEYLGPVINTNKIPDWMTAAHPEEKDEAMQRWQHSLNTGEEFNMDCRLKSIDGSYHWHLCRALPLRDEQHRIVQWFGTATNIEQQRQLLSTLEEERRIRDQLVFTLSHDLRNPLAVARGSAQLMLMYPQLQEERKERYLKQVMASMDRADRMIRDLLDANKIGSGEKISLLIEEMDMDSLVHQTLEELKTAHGDHFYLRSTGSLYGFWSNDEIKRVLENLCGNALKYGDGSQKITVTLEETLDRNGIRLSVHNFGSYIPPEEQKTIFSLFHRTHESQSAIKRGWGIGLALVQGIVAAHGGRVEVTSSQTEGTTFYVHLPKDSRQSQRGRSLLFGT